MTKNQVKILSNISTVISVLAVLSFFSLNYLPVFDSPVFSILSFAAIPVAILFFAVSAIIRLYTNHKEEKFRSQELQTFAQTIGWNFYKQPTSMNFLSQIANKLNVGVVTDHPLFGETENLLTGKIEGWDVAVFDQNYYSGTQRNRQQIAQTFFVLNIKEANFPLFCCEPEVFMSKLGELLFKQDIDFESHPIFSKTYNLYGEHYNEQAIRKLFNNSVLQFFEQTIPQTTIGYGNFLLMYEHGYLTPTEEIRPQVRLLIRQAKLFLGKQA